MSMITRVGAPFSQNERSFGWGPDAFSLHVKMFRLRWHASVIRQRLGSERRMTDSARKRFIRQLSGNREVIAVANYVHKSLFFSLKGKIFLANRRKRSLVSMVDRAMVSVGYRALVRLVNDLNHSDPQKLQNIIEEFSIDFRENDRDN